jgi:catechol 2,3-dioxygenase-like lactoylglutathione lyase family enzyme
MGNIRAVEHIGLTVPDLEQATTFFAEAFGARKIYDMISEPLSGPAIEKGLGVPEGAVIEAIRMLRLGNGPNIKLFTYSGVAQRDPVVPSDYGLQHFCVYVDDIDAAAAQLEKAGGTPLSRAPACSVIVRLCPSRGRGGGGLRRGWCGHAVLRGCAGSQHL